MEKRGQRIPRNHHRAAVHTLHHAQRKDRADHGNSTRGNIRNERRTLVKPSLFEHLNAVVHDGVNTGELLPGTHQNTDQQNPHKPFFTQDFTRAALSPRADLGARFLK